MLGGGRWTMTGFEKVILDSHRHTGFGYGDGSGRSSLLDTNLLASTGVWISFGVCSSVARLPSLHSFPSSFG
jgi:hypothetical protein